MKHDAFFELVQKAGSYFKTTLGTCVVEIDPDSDAFLATFVSDVGARTEVRLDTELAFCSDRDDTFGRLYSEFRASAKNA